MHRLYLGVLYFQNIVRFEGTGVTAVYNFRLYEKYGLPGADFHNTGQQSTALRADKRISSKSDNKCGKYA